MTVTPENEWAGAQLAALRRAAGLTQAQLAALAGIDRSRFNQIERGAYPISRYYADLLAPHLNVNPELLLPAPAQEQQEPSPLDRLQGLADSVERQQGTLDVLLQRVEALERGGEGQQRPCREQ